MSHKKMMTVQEQWAFFEKLVLHKDAPPIQRREMRLAFFAGAEAMLRMQYDLGDLSDDAGVALMSSWHDELERFAKTQLKERTNA